MNAHKSAGVIELNRSASSRCVCVRAWVRNYACAWFAALKITTRFACADHSRRRSRLRSLARACQKVNLSDL